MNDTNQGYIETFITKALKEYIEDREESWQDYVQVQRIWMWSFVAITLVSIFICIFSIRFFLIQGEIWNGYMHQQSILSHNRELREIEYARRDSIGSIRDDSLAKVYIKSMSRYEKMPYYKTERGDSNVGKGKIRNQ